MPKTPTCGNFHNRCIRLCRLDGPAHGVEPQRPQIGHGIHTYHLFKRILQAAPAHAKHAAKVGNAWHFIGLRLRIITHSRNQSATPARVQRHCRLLWVFPQADELVIKGFAQRFLRLCVLQKMRCFGRNLQGRIEKPHKTGMLHRGTEELRDPGRATQGFVGRNRLRIVMKIGTVYGHGKYLATRGYNYVELLMAAKNRPRPWHPLNGHASGVAPKHCAPAPKQASQARPIPFHARVAIRFR